MSTRCAPSHSSRTFRASRVPQRQWTQRRPRLVRLSARGAAFLDAAREFVAAHERALAGLSGTTRRLALGISDHVAGPDLPILLTRLHAYDPALLIEVQIESSRELLDAFERGKLDAAILRREDDRRNGEVLALGPLGWFASPGFVHRAGGRGGGGGW